MRKYSIRKGQNGITRLQLNNKDYFQFGPLDQGWWPDGLYTAPTDEALVYDLKKTKDFGYNMVRKHVKVEPARWYTHCDQFRIDRMARYAERLS
jgi:beta-galactosidase/beta-glucuronidase